MNRIMRIAAVMLAAGLMATGLFAAGCARNGGAGGDVNSVTVKGSDTMVHLVSTWGEAFMNENPDMQVSVTGGGSGTGIAAIINGTTDVCAASRTIKEKEMQLAEEKGITPEETVVARDGIAIVVNPGNTVDTLTLEQLKKIYIGAYTNWSQVGGPDANILLLSRDNSSGTYVFFQEHVLDKENYASSARKMTATSAIIQSVSEDAAAIGYVGLGYADNAGDSVKVVGIKEDASSQAVHPSIDTVRDGSYSIARPLHFYTNGAPEGATKQFIDFCRGEKGQEIVVETGYVPY